MSTADEVYARIDDLVPPSDLEILDGFCTAIAERNNLAARLAEVEDEAARLAEGWTEANESEKELEAERDEARRRLAEVEAENAELIEKLKAGLSRDDRTSLSSLFGYDLGVEEGRAEGQAERDRLAQELETAIGHMWTWDTLYRRGQPVPRADMKAAGEFLARFPVKEGDEG